MPPKKTDAPKQVKVGQPVWANRKGDLFLGICHAIDSRLEGEAIIEEVKMFVLAHRPRDCAYFIPYLVANNDRLFELSEVVAVL